MLPKLAYWGCFSLFALALVTAPVGLDIDLSGEWQKTAVAKGGGGGGGAGGGGAGAGGGNQPLIDRGGEAVDDLSSWQPQSDVVRSEPPAPEFKAKQLGLDL